MQENLDLPIASAWFGHTAKIVSAEQISRRCCGPQSLWQVGHIDDGAPRVGVVGSRKATAEQSAAARQVCEVLVAAGVTIVSGGAVGIDTEAHRTALRWGGRTIVCLPAGVRNGGSNEQRPLCLDVLAAGGAVISCEKPETAHLQSVYKRRNRVIVGLIDALVVVCGGEQSGTLITARFATNAKLPRFAIPWSPSTPNSLGSNDLFTDGWRALHRLGDPEHVLQQVLAQSCVDGTDPAWQGYAPLQPRKPPPLACSGDSNPQLVAAIDRALADRPHEGVSLEELVVTVGKRRGDLAPLLLQLCMAGRLQRAAFGRYMRCG